MKIDSRKIWIATAVGCAVALLAFLRAHVLRSDAVASQLAMEREIRRTVDEGQESFRRIQTVALNSLDSAEAVRTCLLAQLSPARESVSKDERVLIEEAADVIYYRFAQRSPSVYRDWRSSAGYRLKDGGSMRRLGTQVDYEFLLKRPYPGDDHIVQVFEDLWPLVFERDDGSSVPVAVATDNVGVEVAFGELDVAGLAAPPQLAGVMPASVWNGRMQVGFRNWWDDPNGGFQEELQRRGVLPVAYVGIVLELKPGDRYPFAFSFYQDARGEWWLWRVNALNIVNDRLVMIEF